MRQDYIRQIGPGTSRVVGRPAGTSDDHCFHDVPLQAANIVGEYHVVIPSDRASRFRSWPARYASMQIFVGSRYMMESDVQRHLRDARLYNIGGGTSEIQRVVIAHEMGG